MEQDKNGLPIYFAKLKDKDIGDALVGKLEKYNTGFEQHRFYDRIEKSYKLYYGLNHETQTGTKGLGKAGRRGELTRIKVNKYRSNIQHLQSLLTNTRPAYDCRAINSDPESLIQAELGNKILDYTLRAKNFEAIRRTVVEYALVYGEGYVVLDWDVDAGEDFAVKDIEDGKEVVKSGDITFRALTPFEIIKDTNGYIDDQDWYIFQYRVNKFDLEAKYVGNKRSTKTKKMRTSILSVDAGQSKLEYVNSLYNFADDTDSDKIFVYEFRHKKTPAMPYGRLVKFLADGTILSDTDLPFQEINIFKISPSHQFGTVFGYTPAFDIQGLQEAHDRLYSAVLSNNLTFGIQNIIVDNNANLQQQSVAGGLRFLRVNPDSRIEPLNLVKSAPETYGLIDRIEKDEAEGTGVNEAVKGQTPKGITSGTALAYLGSAALQYLSGLDSSKVAFEEGIMTSIINLYKEFGNTPRTLTLIGRSKRAYEADFVGNDLVKINRVIVDSGNPLTKTLVGRIQLAEQFLNMGFIKNPADFLQVIETGSLESVTEGFQKENILIAEENDRLLNQEDVRATLIDDHIQHIREHRGLMADPEIRYNEERRGKILEHILVHIRLYRELKASDPDLLIITQEADLPGPGMPGGPGGAPPQGPGGPAGPAGPGAGAPKPMGNADRGAPVNLPNGQTIKQPRPPSVVKNPATGQPATREIPGGI